MDSGRGQGVRGVEKRYRLRRLKIRFRSPLYIHTFCVKSSASSLFASNLPRQIVMYPELHAVSASLFFLTELPLHNMHYEMHGLCSR